ncbi:MAG: putative toxin-antitoxin system toxin component, PIN family [Chloroflexota bacterium]
MALKVVLDTNVLISGVIAAQGPSARILEAVQRGDLRLITSAALLQEFSEVIVRPHSGDPHLFSQVQHNGIPILRPRQFVTTVLDLTPDTP